MVIPTHRRTSKSCAQSPGCEHNNWGRQVQTPIGASFGTSWPSRRIQLVRRPRKVWPLGSPQRVTISDVAHTASTAECASPMATICVARRARALSVAWSANDLLRRVLLILSVVGLVTSVGLWAASLWGWEMVQCRLTSKYLTAGLANGAFEILFVAPPQKQPHGAASVAVATIALFRWAGLSSPGLLSTWRLPLWMTTVICAACCCMAPIRPIKWRRRRLGLCVACGYNLTGSPEKCPECGQERSPS
jgi:hypothetical protein